MLDFPVDILGTVLREPVRARTLLITLGMVLVFFLIVILLLSLG
jgi:hypothetical protein